MRWAKGADRIETLLRDNELQNVCGGTEAARGLARHG